MDMVVTTRRFPAAGETVFGGRFGMFPGGKGANQAVCAAKLGGKVSFLGKMGKDVFREKLVGGMKRDGVRLEHLAIDSTASTGIALITVDNGGQNEIVVVSGSNMRLLPADIERRRAAIAAARIVLLQLEIPLPTVTRAAEIARAHGVTVILNPAPARRLPASLLRMVDYLTPNETEVGQLAGMPSTNRRSLERAAHVLLRRGVRNVLVTLGAHGCLHVHADGTRLFPARKVRPVDTTAAGDAFNGALAYALAAGTALDHAVPFANTVAALSVTRMGAQSSMPTMSELKTFRRQKERA
jgi:ribokinase